MKITIIGSTAYKDKMVAYAAELKQFGHEVSIPAFDCHPEYDEMGIVTHNKDLISQADRIDVLWDCRSPGTLFDLGMAFALNKPIKVVYLNDKTLENLVKKLQKLHTKTMQEENS